MSHWLAMEPSWGSSRLHLKYQLNQELLSLRRAKRDPHRTFFSFHSAHDTVSPQSLTQLTQLTQRTNRCNNHHRMNCTTCENNSTQNSYSILGVNEILIVDLFAHSSSEAGAVSKLCRSALNSATCNTH